MKTFFEYLKSWYSTTALIIACNKIYYKDPLAYLDYLRETQPTSFNSLEASHNFLRNLTNKTK